MKRLFGLALLLTLSVGMAGCGWFQRGTGQMPPFAPPHVQIATPVMRQITDYEEFTGRTAAKDTVNVIARATGYLVSANFKEGDLVKRGELLFLIEPKPYQALVDQAAAAVKQNEAQVAQAIADNVRAQELIKTPGAISKQDVDRYQTALEQATANLQASKAVLEMNQINLGYCRTLSKIDGRASNYLVTPGNVVTKDQTLLTTVVSQDPIYVYFDIDERTYLRIKHRDSSVKSVSSVPPDTSISLGLSTEKGYPHEGTVNFTDNHVDPLTGTIRKRGVFPNPDLTLTPGLFARIRLPITPLHPALLIPENALGTEQERRFVYVVVSKTGVDEKDPNARVDVVEQRVVNVGALHGELRVIEEGISTGDRVVINPLPSLQQTIQQNKGRVVVDSQQPAASGDSEKSRPKDPPATPERPPKAPPPSPSPDKEAVR